MKTTAEFEINYAVPQVFGCIDGNRIPIKRPHANSQDYFNHKMFHPNVQAVRDSKGCFVGIVAGQAQYMVKRLLQFQIQTSDPAMPIIFCQ